MKKLILLCSVCICVFSSMIAANKSHSSKGLTNVQMGNISSAAANSIRINYWIDSLFSEMNLAAAGLSREAFFEACTGYEYLLSQNAIQKPGIITICDFSQCSNKKRLYVLDLDEQKLLFNTYVSHGKNSGNEYATSFSNNADSYKSSLGFLLTAETYIGEHGYSMKLDGLEKGFNNNVRDRAIVMHSSDYVCQERAVNGVMMGRSFGCPAVPASELTKIVNCIKGGSCFFNYYPDLTYNKNSRILNTSFAWPVLQSIQLASVKVPDSLKSIAMPSALN